MSGAAEEIDFARYAEICAHLRFFPADRRDEVIGRLGVRPRAFASASARWGAARDAEIARGEADLTARFGAIAARTRKRLDLQRPAIESLGPLPPPEEAAPPAPDPVPDPAPVPVPEVAPPEVQRSSAQIDPPRAALPSYLAQPAPVPIAISLPAIIEAPPAPPPSARLAVTAPLSGPLPIAPSLPFKGGAADPDKALTDAVAHAAEVQGPAKPRAEAPAPTGTVGVGTIGPGDGLPFAAAPPPGCPDLKVTQYASLRVELHADPDRAAAILARYGVAPGAREALEGHWRSRFDADPLLRMEFARAYASYLGWLRQNPRR